MAWTKGARRLLKRRIPPPRVGGKLTAGVKGVNEGVGNPGGSGKVSYSSCRVLVGAILILLVLASSRQFAILFNLGKVQSMRSRVSGGSVNVIASVNANVNATADIPTSSGTGGTTLETSKFQDDFLVLRNVCLTRMKGNDGDIMHFFSPALDDEHEVQRSADVFNKKHPKPFKAWDSDIPPSLYPPLYGAHAKLVVNSTIDSWMNLHNKSILMNGTTIVVEPHHPDNNFHLHNDFMIGLLYKVMKSESRHVDTLRLYLAHGSKTRYNKRVVAYDALNSLFDEILYPLEDVLTNNGSVCFNRLVWGKLIVPYYGEIGRFGADNKWKGVVPQIRDWIFEAHGIARESTQRAPDKLNRTKQRPKVTWIDRPCLGNTDSRCIRNEAQIISSLSSRFDVEVLSFNRENARSHQLHKMLSIMSETDVLIGMHGAGLGHIAYLPPTAIVVEIKGNNNRHRLKIFLNMASKQDIGYYLFDAQKVATDRANPGVLLTDAHMHRFADDLWAVWNLEVKRRVEIEKNNTYHDLLNKCLFPQYLSDTILSSFNVSRCYLEQTMLTRKWYQCTHYNDCPNNIAR